MSDQQISDIYLLAMRLQDCLIEFCKDKKMSKQDLVLGYMSGFNILLLSLFEKDYHRKGEAKRAFKSLMITLNKFRDYVPVSAEGQQNGQ